MTAILFLGDIHGDFGALSATLATRPITGQTIVQAGDFGVGFRRLDDEREMLANLNRMLSRGGNTLFAIRGNHDDPSLFDESSPHNHSNLKLLPDYSVIEADGRKLLLVGGAISVDRLVRRAQGLGYWPDEGFTYEEAKLEGLDLSNLWAVVTHAAPTVAPPYELNRLVRAFIQLDPGLEEELPREREELDKLLDAVLQRATPKYWVYGHYHSRARKHHKGIEFVMLDVGQIVELY